MKWHVISLAMLGDRASKDLFSCLVTEQAKDFVGES
uniref:Uncharacterized protein n=1 Tax=Arundo donax TaxID=35708 RepID=A0A0A9CFY6_ARUDO